MAILLLHKFMEKQEKVCDTCGKTLDKCVCCDPCGHSCMLDHGEPYCPVCFPEPGE